MINDTLVDTITTRALVENFSNREKTRREQCETNFNYYYDRGIEYINLVNSDVTPISMNMVRSIIGKRTSLLYGQKLVREMVGPKQSVDFITNFYNTINIDKFLLSVDLATELTGTGLVHIKSDDSNEFGINLQLFNGKDITLLSNLDDPNKADAISIIRVVDIYNSNTKSVETLVQQQVWTENSVVTYENSSGSNPQLADSRENNLGMLPFVIFNGEEVDGQCIGHPNATGVRQLNSALNELLTNLGYMIKMESFNILAIEGYEAGTAISIHPGKALNLPIGAKAYSIDFSPKIKETLEAISYIENKMYDLSSVPKVSIVGGEANSGKELMIKWFPLIQVFREKAVRWTNYELNLMNTILKIVGLPEIEYLKVHYPEDKVLPMSTDMEDVLRDIKVNVSSPIDEIMRRDPDLSEEEAMAIYLANIDINSRLSQTLESVDNKSGQPGAGNTKQDSQEE